MEAVLLGLVVIAYLIVLPFLLAGARQRIRVLEQRVARLQQAVRSLGGARSEREEAPAGAGARSLLGTDVPAQPRPLPAVSPAIDPVSQGPARPAETGPEAEVTPAPAVRAPGREASGSAPFFRDDIEVPNAPGADWVERAKAWLLGGNTVARVGVVILFFGVAFFLKYVAERGLLPTELRLGAAALGGLLLGGIGWWQRERRRGYGLVLQGGGAGIVYLTVFAAVQLYELLPPGPGLGLMVVLVALGCALAVLQDARSLALLAMVGGFLAPLLISRGGSHVQLFAYYAVLDAGILAIAWHKAWRELNLVGFVFTFVIGGVWGYEYYQPRYFASTEPFLALFFLLYVAVPVLFAERQAPNLKGYVDGSLVFGVPLVAFGLQAALVRNLEHGLAWSALAAGLFYALVALALRWRRREHLRLLSEAFGALAVAFSTLAIPLAVDGRWIGTAWALEGAAMVWIGLRQGRALARAFGLLVQLAAGISFLVSAPLPAAAVPVLNSLYLSALMISLAGLFSACQLARLSEAPGARERRLGSLMLVWGLVWWYGAGVNEIREYVPAAGHYDALLGLVTASSLALALLGRWLDWAQLARAALLLLPAMVVIALVQYIEPLAPHPLAHWGWLAWGAAFTGHYWLLRPYEVGWPGKFFSCPLHSVGLWLLVFLAVQEGWWAVGQVATLGPTWRYLVPGLIPALVVLSVPPLTERVAWPLGAFRNAYIDRGLVPLVVVAGLWVLHASLQPGDPRPLSYLPLLNPLELGQCIALAAIFASVLRDWRWVSVPARWRGLGLLGFVAVNGAIARATHFLGGVAFGLDPLWASPRYQTAVSISWTLIALAAMVGGSRLRERSVWILGAGLLGAVVAKLFIVDLAGTGTLARIVSFIGVGLLILVIGFLSPLPPRAEQRAAP